MIDESSDLSDDIVPDKPQHSQFERPFEPWHKVRKEFIRKEQWNKFIVRYAKGIPKTEDHTVIDRPLKCLVIPGADLLDIRSLYRDTSDIGCFISYLGFNSQNGSDQQGTRIHIANNDVTSLDRISDNSCVIKDKFQSIASDRSLAMRRVRGFGPFNIVNLDVCDSLFPKQHCDLTSYYQALHQLVIFQMKEMAKPWLLFITSEVAPQEVDTEQLNMFCKPTKENISKHPDFANALSKVLPIAALSGDSNDNLDCSQLTERQLIDLFGIAMGKVLLSFCSTTDPKWKIVMLGSHIYTINKDKSVSMLSLAFQFEPTFVPPMDTTGLSSLSYNPKKPFDELELAKKLISSVQNISDIDQILIDCPVLRAQLLESSADLLKSAGYNRGDYIQWVQDGERTNL